MVLEVTDDENGEGRAQAPADRDAAEISGGEKLISLPRRSATCATSHIAAGRLGNPEEAGIFEWAKSVVDELRGVSCRA